MGITACWQAAALENGEPSASDDDNDPSYTARIPEIACVHWNFKDAASIPFGELGVPTTGPCHPHLIFTTKIASHIQSPDSVVTKLEIRSCSKNINWRRPRAKVTTSRSWNKFQAINLGYVIIMIIASTIAPSGNLSSLILFRGLSWLRSWVFVIQDSTQKLRRCNFFQHCIARVGISQEKNRCQSKYPNFIRKG